MKINNFDTKQEHNFTQNVYYEEWQRDNNPQPKKSELNDMENVFCQATV
jgi:hypothetical protein